MRIHKPPLILVERSMIVGDNDTFLFVKRAFDDSSQGGEWEFPGGKVEKGESREEARFRETEEETGLRTIPLYDDLVHTQDNTVRHHSGLSTRYMLRTSLCRIVGGEFALSDEHTEALWLPSTEANDNLHLTVYCKIALNSLTELLRQSKITSER